MALTCLQLCCRDAELETSGSSYAANFQVPPNSALFRRTYLCSCIGSNRKIENQSGLGRFLVRPAYSLGLLLAQDSAQTLNVARNDGQRNVSLEANDSMVRTDIQAMLLQRIDR